MHFSSMNFNWAHSSKSSEFVVDKNIPVKLFKICHIHYIPKSKLLKVLSWFHEKKTYGHKYYVAASISFEEKSYPFIRKMKWHTRALNLGVFLTQKIPLTQYFVVLCIKGLLHSWEIKGFCYHWIDCMTNAYP